MPRKLFRSAASPRRGFNSSIGAHAQNRSHSRITRIRNAGRLQSIQYAESSGTRRAESRQHYLILPIGVPYTRRPPDLCQGPEYRENLASSSLEDWWITLDPQGSVAIDTNRQSRQSSILIDITVSIVYLFYTNHSGRNEKKLRMDKLPQASIHILFVEECHMENRVTLKEYFEEEDMDPMQTQWAVLFTASPLRKGRHLQAGERISLQVPGPFPCYPRLCSSGLSGGPRRRGLPAFLLGNCSRSGHTSGCRVQSNDQSL
jgi:hypothetical protein